MSVYVFLFCFCGLSIHTDGVCRPMIWKLCVGPPCTGLPWDETTAGLIKLTQDELKEERDEAKGIIAAIAEAAKPKTDPKEDAAAAMAAPK